MLRPATVMTDELELCPELRSQHICYIACRTCSSTLSCVTKRYRARDVKMWATLTYVQRAVGDALTIPETLCITCGLSL